MDAVVRHAAAAAGTGWEAVAPYDQALTPAPVLALVESLSAQAGVTDAEVRLFIGLLAAYPAGLTWRALPGRAAVRDVFSVVVGLWLLQFVYGAQCVLNLGCVLLCYAVMWAAGPRSARLVSVLAMTMLAAGHLYRQLTAYLEWTLDWTLVAMVTTQKVMGLAYNVQDGADARATPGQKALAVQRLPSLLEYMSFMLFPASVVIGPSFEYADYRAFAERRAAAPAPYVPGLLRLLHGLGCFVTHMAIGARFPCTTLLNDKVFFEQTGVVVRFASVWVALLGHRLRYYFGWKIAEGAACMSGLGYNGVDKTTGKHRWDRVENIDVWQYEASQSLRQSSTSWNKTTNRWLRAYVYDRAPPGVNLYFTYLVSAFWHGFYPGYYMFFLSTAVCTNVHRNFRRAVRPRFLTADGKPGPLKPAYDLFSFVATAVTVNYFIMSFVVLALDQSLVAFRGFGFLGHYVLAAALVLVNSGLLRAPQKKDVPQESKKAQ